MKKTLALCTFLLLLNGIIFGETQNWPFENSAFEDDEFTIYVFPWVDQIDPIPNTKQSYDYSCRDKENRFEVRYAMFNQKDPVEDPELSVYSWSWMVAQKIIMSEKLFSEFKTYDAENLKNEFNADYGLTTSAKTDATDWTKDFSFMLINFYFKDEIGIMCQTILFNDLDLINSKDFVDLFHSFRFK